MAVSCLLFIMYDMPQFYFTSHFLVKHLHSLFLRYIMSVSPALRRGIPPATAPTSPSKRKEIKLTCCQKTAQVAKKIFQAILYIAWMLFQAPLFFTGVIVGTLFPQLMQKAVDKIKELWKKQPCAVIGMTALVTALAFPVTIMASAFIIGGHLGITFSNGVAKMKPCCKKTKKEPPLLPSPQRLVAQRTRA